MSTPPFGAVTVVAKEGMLQGAWFLRDAEDNILSSGVVGTGRLDTPGADLTQGVLLQCHPALFDALKTKLEEPK